MSHCSSKNYALNCLHFFTSHLCFNLSCSYLCPQDSTETTLDKVFKDLLKIASVTPSCPHFTRLLSSFLTPYFACMLPLSWSSSDLPDYSFAVPCVGSPPSMPLFNGGVSQGLVFGPLLFLFTSIHHWWSHPVLWIEILSIWRSFQIHLILISLLQIYLSNYLSFNFLIQKFNIAK